MKYIELSGGESAIVDDDMYDYLNQWNWRLHGGRGQYVVTDKFKKTIAMHRLIVKAKRGEEVNHINGNVLDNRRENLRTCSHAESQYNRVVKQSNNSSGYRGVHWHKGGRVWQARIAIKGKKIWIGDFSNPEDAAHAYDTKAKELFGGFARLNFQGR